MRRAFTVMELVRMIAIFAFVLIVGFPVFQRSHSVVDGPYCPSNLKQIGTALQMYLQDYDQRLPPHGYVVGTQSYTLPQLLVLYLPNARVWQCPSPRSAGDRPAAFDGTPADTTMDYGYNWSGLEVNGVGVQEDQVREPGATVTFTDSTSYLVAPASLVPVLGGTPPAYRHGDQTIVGWLDGHVKAMSAPKLEETPGTEGARKLGSGIDAYRYWNRR